MQVCPCCNHKEHNDDFDAVYIKIADSKINIYKEWGCGICAVACSKCGVVFIPMQEDK